MTKRPNTDTELESSNKDIGTLGIKLLEEINVSLPDEELDHKILVFKKIEEAPKKYPRKHDKPSKNPL